MASSRKQIPDFSHRPFSELDQLVDRKKLRDPLPHASDIQRSEDTQDDEELFRRGMAGVREIPEFRQLKPPPPPSRQARRQHDHAAEARRALEDITRGKCPIRIADTSEYVEWVNPSRSIPAAITKELHSGRFSVKESLDLHGLKVEEAETAVGAFLEEAVRLGHRCVKIIHGRGLKSPRGPVLKEAVRRLLSGPYSKFVDAFATARQCDSGLGALYVLLRTARPQPRRKK